MDRPARIDVPDVAQYVVQHGNNRLPCVLDDKDRQRYLRYLHEALLRHAVQLYAYVLMSDHVHLLVTPCDC